MVVVSGNTSRVESDQVEWQRNFGLVCGGSDRVDCESPSSTLAESTETIIAESGAASVIAIGRTGTPMMTIRRR